MEAYILGRWAKGPEWHVYYDKGPTAKFFGRYACNIVYQQWLCWLGRDIVKFTRILDRLPQAEVHVVSLSYDAGQLEINARDYGKPAPEHPFELALYSSQPAVDTGYYDYVQHVVDEAIKHQRMIGVPV